MGLNAQWFGAHTVKDIQKISTATKNYNLIAQKSITNAQKYATTIGTCDEKFGAYLKNLNGAKASVAGYSASLVGATIKTVALQAASMALNAALTWGVSLAIQGLIELGTYLWKLVPTTEQLKERLSETAQALADIRSEREGLNDELKTTEERIAELEAKGVLSFTEASELTLLKEENTELERKITLLDAEEEHEVRKYNRTMNATREKSQSKSRSSLFLAGDYSDSRGEGSLATKSIDDITYILELAKAYEQAKNSADGLAGVYNGFMSIETIDNKIDEMGELVSEYETYLTNMRELGVTYQNADEGTKKNMDYAYEIIDAYMVAIGKYDTLFAQVYNRDKYYEARTAIEELAEAGNLTAESLQNLYNQGGNVKEFIDYILSRNTVDWKTMLGDNFTGVAGEDGIVSLDEALKAMSGDTELASKIMGLFANELKKVEDAAEDPETSFKSIAKTLSDGLDELSNKKDILSEVKEELDSFGAISADKISKILEQFSDNDDVQKAVAYYLSGIGTAQQLYDAMAKGYQNDLKLQAQNLATKMQNDEKYYESIGGLRKSFTDYMFSQYKVDLTNSKNLAQAKLDIENQLITNLKNNWGKYYKSSSASLDDEIKRAYDKKKHGGHTDPEFMKYWNELLATRDARDKALKELENLTLDKFVSTGFNASLSTDFDKSGVDKNKEAAEKYFAKLKYNLETNKITEEQYLKSLDAAYKKYYGNKSKYLEEFEQYSQEVYDGFKDMYKEDLEAQKEAWEEKKDAVSEYYDNLRQQIEDAHDEEDYEKEQSEKRKEIFDLDMQIAELMRDGSEKAKARIAELEEERLKAEEELLDFETDKARENELSRLEKEQKAEEKKIQGQIDGIQEQLDKLDEDTISVRNAIIAYAKPKGVTLNFAYASGTRSSVGGFGRINEKGIEMISAPDGNGNYIPMLPSSYVFSAKATEFLWKLATEHSLPQAMYNSIAKSIKTQSSTPSVNIAQPINITMGDVIIKGNADKQTVFEIKKQRESDLRWILQEIIKLQKYS